jgi:hypothetical protein
MSSYLGAATQTDPVRQSIEAAKAMAAAPAQWYPPGSVQWKNKALNIAGQVRNKANGLASELERLARSPSYTQADAATAINWLMALSRTINQI